MKSISGVSFLLVATVLVISVSHSQLTPIINPRMHSECSFYYDKNGILYGDGIQVKFNVRMFNALTNNQFADVKDLNSEFSHTKDLLLSLNNSFGPLTIIKMVPRAMWGDTVGVNHISGKAVRIRDLSQLYMIRFASPVPVDSVAMEFQRLGEVQAASQPVSVFLDDQPNDPSFGSQWNLTPVNSTEAWDITHGDPSIRIGVVDVGCLTTHPDLTQKIVATDGVVGDHGTWVAGVAGAATNNGIGIASLGWNTSLVALSGLQGTNQFLVSKIDSAVTFYRCDVINMSWLLARFVSLALETQLCPNCSAANAAKWVQFGAEVPSDDAGVDDAVSNAMSQGVICVAAAGNQSDNGNLGPDPADCDPWKVPFICNPAAYSGVIGVSATQMVSGTEQYKPGWNYGSEVSVSAPGVGILTTDPGGGYASKDGTSFASPLVAALASVIKALKPSIPATSFSQTVDTILQSSADKIDVSNHSYVNGRNDYLGYGRIKAYKALKYTIEHYSTTIGGAGMTVVLHENFNTASGTTLTILPGTSVQMDPGYYLAINGTINAVGTSSQPITFDRTGTSGSWYGLVLQSGSSGTVSYCNFNNAVVGLTCNASWPTISHNVFRNNYFGIYCNPCGPLIQSNDIQYSTNSGIYLTGATPTIQSNTISNNSSAGIFCHNYSSPYLLSNTLSGNGYGIYCDSYSSPRLAPYPWAGNVIASNGYGIYAYYNCTPQGYNPEGNSIFGNTAYNVAALSGCTVTVEGTWWGAYPPNSYQFYSSGSTIDYSNPLTYNPNPGRPKPGMPPPGQWGPTSDSTFNLAFQDLQAEKYDDAIALFVKVFNANSAGSVLSRQALLFLAQAYESSGKTDFINYLQAQISPKVTPNSDLSIVIRELESHWLVKAGRYADAIAMYQGLHADFASDSDVDKFALFNIGETYSLYLRDNANAKQALTLFQSKYPSDPLVPVASVLMSSAGSLIVAAPQKGGGSTTSNGPTPGGFELSANYPNPFNPSTQISYSLLESGKVSLVIYDVLGREVATLADAYQQSGRYSVTWNSTQNTGIPVSSGVYFARLRVLNDLGMVKFTKTMKLLLMK